MKKIISLLFIFSFFVLNAQVPEGFNYQAVVRNSSGEVVAHSPVSFRISILQDAETGSAVYSETHSVSTNDFGLANLKIGSGDNQTGVLGPDGWGTGSRFIKVEVDPTGGNAFIHMGTMQLMSVPYAFHAQTVEEDRVEDADADASNELQTMSLSGTQFSLSKGGGTVVLPASGEGGDNWGSQVAQTDETLNGDGSPAHPLAVNHDELMPVWSNVQEIPAGFADNIDDVEDADADPTNEIQELSLDGKNLSLSKAGGSVSLPSDDWGSQSIKSDETLDGNGTNSSPLKIAQQSATTGQVLKWSGTTWTPGNVSGGTSLWQQNETDIYYNAGHVGIGTNEPSSSNLLHVYGTALFKGSGNGISIGPNGPAGSINFYYEGGWSANITLDRGKTTLLGYVGIGTHNPEANLHVDDHIRIGEDFNYEDVYGEIFHEGGDDGFKINANANGDWADMHLQTDGTTRLFIESGGNVGIGKLTPGSRLHIKQAGTGFQNGLRLERPDNTNWWSIQINNFNDLVFDYKGTNTRAWIDYETAGYNHSSDRNLKTDINSIKSALNKVMQLNPVTFRFKSNPDSKSFSYGLIAQEVKKIYPEFVSENNGNLGIAYHNFSVINIRAIQEQQEKIMVMQNQIEKLEKQNGEMLKEITKIKSSMNSRLEQLEKLLGIHVQKTD